MSHAATAIPMRDYAADDVGAPEPCLHSSAAHRLLTRSPHHAWWAHPKLGGHASPPNDAMNLGSAAHAILLEGNAGVIDALDYPDWRTAAARAARAESLAAGRIPLLATEAEAVMLMASRAQRAIGDSPSLAGLGPLDSEQTYVWSEHRVNAAGIDRDVWCKSRPDAMSRDRSVVLSYKTTSLSAEPEHYTRTIIDRGYDLQAAFEIAGIEAVDGVRPTHYIWVVQEASEPYEVSLIGLGPQLAERAIGLFDAAVALWGECVARDDWPGYPDRVCYVAPPAWAMAEMERWAS